MLLLTKDFLILIVYPSSSIDVEFLTLLNY